MSNRQTAVATALEMAGRQREISVSEFFLKDRHLLGFDTPAKALITAVKEAVDNALDAVEEAGVLPEITVEVRGRFERSRIAVEDNGRGIVESQIARIFGKLVYGSKFHKLSRSRGQQGMGNSSALDVSDRDTSLVIVILGDFSFGKARERLPKANGNSGVTGVSSATVQAMRTAARPKSPAARITK